jgi:hypothetical protein
MKLAIMHGVAARIMREIAREESKIAREGSKIAREDRATCSFQLCSRVGTLMNPVNSK